jgi:probable rRNA maturation factor
MDSLEVDIQTQSSHQDIPTPDELIKWTKAALAMDKAEIAIRIVDVEEMTKLNSTYRKKQGATNVLSFPFTSPFSGGVLLGDIIVCAPLISQEAKEQKKSLRAHWAHLIVHGTLHLQGYDHIEREDAKIMAAKEIEILSKLGIPNPYQ